MVSGVFSTGRNYVRPKLQASGDVPVYLLRLEQVPEGTPLQLLLHHAPRALPRPRMRPTAPVYAVYFHPCCPTLCLLYLACRGLRMRGLPVSNRPHDRQVAADSMWAMRAINLVLIDRELGSDRLSFSSCIRIRPAQPPTTHPPAPPAMHSRPPADEIDKPS